MRCSPALVIGPCSFPRPTQTYRSPMGYTAANLKTSFLPFLPPQHFREGYIGPNKHVLPVHLAVHLALFLGILSPAPLVLREVPASLLSCAHEASYTVPACHHKTTLSKPLPRIIAPLFLARNPAHATFSPVDPALAPAYLDYKVLPAVIGALFNAPSSGLGCPGDGWPSGRRCIQISLSQFMRPPSGADLRMGTLFRACRFLCHRRLHRTQ